MLMAQHPDIATIGELKATRMGSMEKYTCSCGKKIYECGFWMSLIDTMNRRNIKLDLNDFDTHFNGKQKYISRVLLAQIRTPFFEYLRKLTIKILPGLNKRFNTIMDKNKNMIDAICEIQGRNYFLDGSKDPQRLLYFLESDTWNVKVISMIRDGRAQSNSCRQKKGNDMDYKRSAKEWKSTVRQMERLCERIDSAAIYYLKYEDLCASPNNKMNDIWDFIGIKHIEKDWLDLDVQHSDFHILGNNMRTKQTIRIRLDEGWRSVVNQEELSIFESIAGELNRSYGYK